MKNTHFNLLKTCSILLIFSIVTHVSNAQTLKKGLIVQLSIEGTQQTDMSTFYNGTRVEQFNARITQNTIKRLKELFQLDTIEFADGVGLEYKLSLNKFVGVNKVNKKFLNQAQNYDLVFKMKCDIAFNETAGGFLIDQTSSRAAVDLSVGVFNKNLEKQTIYKGRAKDGVVFLGENARRVQYLTKEDFEAAYTSCLEELNNE
ncbi:MAG: hypothetical protein QM539_08120 [Alphaproteobacteria bacterium]|nr:hypothetical protein [Alphaproteobacteria bacterium]